MRKMDRLLDIIFSLFLSPSFIFFAATQSIPPLLGVEVGMSVVVVSSSAGGLIGVIFGARGGVGRSFGYWEVADVGCGGKLMGGVVMGILLVDVSGGLVGVMSGPVGGGFGAKVCSRSRSSLECI